MKLIYILNNGGLVSLSLLFLGLISPLMTIDLYKRRIKITAIFINTDGINQFIETIYNLFRINK